MESKPDEVDGGRDDNGDEECAQGGIPVFPPCFVGAVFAAKNPNAVTNTACTGLALWGKNVNGREAVAWLETCCL